MIMQQTHSGKWMLLLFALVQPILVDALHVYHVRHQLNENDGRSVLFRNNGLELSLATKQNFDDGVSEDEEDLSLEAFQRVQKERSRNAEEEEFSGYDFRDIIVAKWGKCYDVDFNRVDTLGFRGVYLNIFPFHPGRKPFRHETEYDYLCHLQAVVEILVQYDQLHYVLHQIGETTKRPIPGRSPLVAVPCRLDLTDEQVDSILGGGRS